MGFAHVLAPSRDQHINNHHTDPTVTRLLHKSCNASSPYNNKERRRKVDNPAGCMLLTGSCFHGNVFYGNHVASRWLSTSVNCPLVFCILCVWPGKYVSRFLILTFTMNAVGHRNLYVVIHWPCSWHLFYTMGKYTNPCGMIVTTAPVFRCSNVIAWWRNQMETFSALLALCEGFHRSPLDSPDKGQWRRVLMYSLNCAWTNGSAYYRDAYDLRRHRNHHDVIVMTCYLDCRRMLLSSMKSRC